MIGWFSIKVCTPPNPHFDLFFDLFNALVYILTNLFSTNVDDVSKTGFHLTEREWAMVTR